MSTGIEFAVDDLRLLFIFCKIIDDDDYDDAVAAAVVADERVWEIYRQSEVRMGISDNQSAKKPQGRKETASCAVSIPMVETEVGLSCHDARRLACS